MPTYEFRLPDGTIIEKMFKMSDVPDMRPTHPPDLGQHTDEVLRRWLGAPDEQIADLKARRVT